MNEIYCRGTDNMDNTYDCAFVGEGGKAGVIWHVNLEIRQRLARLGKNGPVLFLYADT